MPSPIAHLSVGYFLYYLFARRIPAWQWKAARPWRFSIIVAAFFFLSMAPDLDALVGIATGNLGRYHNQWTHSLVACIGAALIFGVCLQMLLRDRIRYWIAAAFCCYGTHLLMDICSYGRGIMALWPLTDERFLSPVLLFVGLHWSQDLWHPMHLLTLINELLFTAILLALGKRLSL